MTPDPNLPWTAHRPLPVTAARYRPRPMINLSRLRPSEKRAMWARIRAERPLLAALLLEPECRKTMEHFGCEVCVEPFGESRS